MTVSYQVVAPLVLVKDEAGKIHYAYEGATVRLSDEQAEHFLAEGLVEKSGNGGDDDAEDDDRPKKAAPKADWVEYAVADGYDRDEVEAMSKADIQALFD